MSPAEHYRRRRATLMDDLRRAGMSAEAIGALYGVDSVMVAAERAWLATVGRVEQPWRGGWVE